MSNIWQINADIVNALRAVIHGLPDDMLRLELVLVVEEIPTLKITRQFIRHEDGEPTVEASARTYKIEPVDAEAA